MNGRVNGHDADFENPPSLDKNFRHDIDVRIDRFVLSKDRRHRTTEAVENALRLGGGTRSNQPTCTKNTVESDGMSRPEHPVDTTISWSEDFACPEHGAFMPELSPRVFSFNSPLGACPECQGLGIQRQFNPDSSSMIHLQLQTGVFCLGDNLCRLDGTRNYYNRCVSTMESPPMFRSDCLMRMRKTSFYTALVRPLFIPF